jgi:hypothetical protein
MGNPISIIGVRASPPVLSVSLSTLKSDEENSTYARLAQENGFSPACLLSLSLLKLVKSGSKTVDLLAKMWGKPYSHCHGIRNDYIWSFHHTTN